MPTLEKIQRLRGNLRAVYRSGGETALLQKLVDANKDLFLIPEGQSGFPTDLKSDPWALVLIHKYTLSVLKKIGQRIVGIDSIYKTNRIRINSNLNQQVIGGEVWTSNLFSKLSMIRSIIPYVSWYNHYSKC